MVIGKPCQRLLIVLLVALLPGPAMAVSDPMPAEKSAALAALTTVQPASVSARAAGLSQPSEFVTDVPAAVSARPMGPAVFAGLSVLEILLIGGALIALAMYARRRHRRRIGWGIIPDRSFGRMRRVG